MLFPPLKGSISSLAFNIIVNIILTQSFGIVGTSIAVGLSYVFFFVLRTLVSNHVYKIKFHFIRMFSSVAILFSFALVNSLSVNTLLNWSLAFVSYFAIFVMYKDVLVDLKTIIAKKLKK